MSDKAFKLNKKQNQLVLRVHPQATKPQIKTALEKLFNVKVDTVRTTMKKKQQAKAVTKRYRAKPSVTRIKKAYVTLSEGHTLNLFEQTGIPAGEEKK